MDFFLRANTVRLVSYWDKYLIAEDDQVTISQGSDGSAKNAIWAVEFVEGKDCIRLKSCFGTYLTATRMPFLLGFPGKKVIQRLPSESNTASEWEPLRDGMQIRLRSNRGYYLRPNSSLPPWRNAVTHDIPHVPKTREKLLWNVEVVDKCPTRQRIVPQESTTNGWLTSGTPAGLQNRMGCNVKRALLKNPILTFSSAARWPWFWYRRICLGIFKKTYSLTRRSCAENRGDVGGSHKAGETNI